MTAADRPSVTDDARAEALRRWTNPPGVNADTQWGLREGVMGTEPRSAVALEPEAAQAIAQAIAGLLDDARAEAWDEGVRAQAAAYGMDPDAGPNPYRAAGRAETTTATTEAEAGARALEQAADEVARIDQHWDSALWIADDRRPRGGQYVPVPDWLRERAARIRGGAR